MIAVAFEVTEEIRVAVRAEDCARWGHMLNLEQAIVGGAIRGLGAHIGRDDGLQPHLTCRRCEKVWLIEEVPADGYDAAEAASNERLRPEHRRTRTRRREARPGPGS